MNIDINDKVVRRTSVIALWLVLSSAFALSACSEDVPGCRKDLDCNAGRLCVDRACVYVGDEVAANNRSDHGAKGDELANNGRIDDPGNNDQPDNNDASDAGMPDDSDTGGPDVPPVDPPVFVFDPTTINFGEVNVGESAMRTAVIVNQGGSPLTIERLDTELPEGAGFAVTLAEPLPLTLAPAARVEFTLTFAPSAPSEVAWSGSVFFDSDDPARPRAGFPIAGVALAPPAGPCLSLSRVSLDFGEVARGTSTSAETQVTNCGTDNLALDPPTIMGQGSGLQARYNGPPGMLQPGRSRSLEVFWAPTTLDPLAARVNIRSRPQASATLNVTGTPTSESTNDACAIADVPVLEEGTLFFDLCDYANTFSNLTDGQSCTASGEDYPGNDRIFQFTLNERRRVVLGLRDEDDVEAIDTILYLRRACQDPTSQVACADDVRCEDSSVEFGCGDNGIQVRESRFNGELDPGTWYVIADQLSYESFTCGYVALEFEVRR